MKRKDTIILTGEEYILEYKNNTRYINGELVDDFIDRLVASNKWNIICDFANVGMKSLTNNLTFNSPRQELISNIASESQLPHSKLTGYSCVI